MAFASAVSVSFNTIKRRQATNKQAHLQKAPRCCIVLDGMNTLFAKRPPRNGVEVSMRLPSSLALLLLLPAFGALAEPDEEVLGKADGYPRGTAATMHAERFKVGSFSAADQITPSHRVARGDGEVTPLPRRGEAAIAYRFKGQPRTLDAYLDRQRVTGLLVLKNGAIVAERYRYGRTEHDRFLSFSMAKTVASLLIGLAVEKGFIKSLDDPAENYVPELEGRGYGQATVRQLLRMSSGMKWVENYDGKDDIARLERATRGLIAGGPLRLLASCNECAFPTGEKFGYSSSESMVLGYVLARAVGKDVATITRDWLWQPLGAEADGAWLISVDGRRIRSADSMRRCATTAGSVCCSRTTDRSLGGRSCRRSICWTQRVRTDSRPPFARALASVTMATVIRRGSFRCVSARSRCSGFLGSAFSFSPRRALSWCRLPWTKPRRIPTQSPSAMRSAARSAHLSRRASRAVTAQ